MMSRSTASTRCMPVLALALALATPFALRAQAPNNHAPNNEGHIEYEEVVAIQINPEDIPEEYRQFAAMIPKERRNNKVLHFTPQESLYETSTKVVESENNPFGEGRGPGRGMRMGFGMGITYMNVAEDAGVRFEDMMGKKFLIELPAQKTAWKLSNTQKEIAGYLCMKATAVVDSVEVIAWFAPQIPVPTGPRGMNDLPGAILQMEMAIERGYLTVTATSVELVALEDPIQAPKKGEKVTEAEFEETMRQRFEEMRAQWENRGKNGGRGGGPMMMGGGPGGGRD